jgi:hypothetical protein
LTAGNVRRKGGIPQRGTVMVWLTFASFIVLACMVAFVDWRRGWLLAVVVGILQDPARKLTAGAPVAMTMSIVAVYIAIIFVNQGRLQRAVADFSQRFPRVWSAFGLLFFFLILAALNGLMTFGITYWKVPLLSLFIYIAPLPAVLLGYMYVDREEAVERFFRFYAVVTSIALTGSLLEYLRVNWKVLGMVSQVGDYIRHLPGIQIRMISGFYRAPDIMGCHAATLTCIAIAGVVRSNLGRRAWLWMLASGWGFFNCMISGRRKAIYFVAVFGATLLWRYWRRLKPAQVAAFLAALLVLGYVVQRIYNDESSSVYAKGAVATQQEVAQRLEGGLMGTIEQSGILGLGLGTATQGVYHLFDGKTAENIGWQEGGLGKLAVELGLPGLGAAFIFIFVVLRLMLRISSFPDERASSQLMRVTLLGLVLANIANFCASAQTYSDPVLTLLAAFFVGSLFATATLDERVPASIPIQSLAPATA